MDDSSSKLAALRLEVDTEVLDDVWEAIGAEQLSTFMTSVVADIGQLIGRLDGGAGPEVLDAVGREAHHLSGGCRSMGLVGIGAVCARIEADARRRIDQQWPAYSAELSQQRQALIEWWSNTRARYS